MKIKSLLAGAALAALATGTAHAESDVPKPDKVAVCATCHGENGVSAAPIFPNLAGQQRDYLYHALTQYHSGARKNAIMGAQAAGLSKDEMKALALWYSSQKPVLYTPDPDPEVGATGPAAKTETAAH